MTLNYGTEEGIYQPGKWTWFFSVCSAFGNTGLIETEIALRMFRHHTRDVKLHVLYADPKNSELSAVIKCAEPDLYIEQSHNFGKMGNLDILVQTIRTEFAAVAHCDTFIVADDLFRWPSAVFHTYPEVKFIYPSGMVGGFTKLRYELNPCYSFLCCFRTQVWHNHAIRFGVERNVFQPGRKLALFKGVGGYEEAPCVCTETVGCAYFRLIKLFGVESTLVFPSGFVCERVVFESLEFHKKTKAIHAALTYWPKQGYRTGKESLGYKVEHDYVVKKRKMTLKLLKKYRELTPNIPVVDYEISDSVGIIEVG